MFLDAVGETLYNIGNGFASGWNQSIGYQSAYAQQYNPYYGQYYPVPINAVPTQYPPVYPQPYTQSSSLLPILVVGGILLIVLLKD